MWIWCHLISFLIFVKSVFWDKIIIHYMRKQEATRMGHFFLLSRLRIIKRILTYFSGLLTPCGLQHPFLESGQSSNVWSAAVASLHRVTFSLLCWCYNLKYNKQQINTSSNSLSPSHIVTFRTNKISTTHHWLGHSRPVLVLSLREWENILY